jgi:hypothetical protein
MKSKKDGIYQLNPLFIGIQPILSPKEKRYIKKLLILPIIILFNSPPLSININQKDNFFPSDFFEPINCPSNSSSIKPINYNSGNKTKSTYVNLQKEEEEDKELLDLLEGKRK